MPVCMWLSHRCMQVRWCARADDPALHGMCASHALSSYKAIDVSHTPIVFTYMINASIYIDAHI